VDFLTTNLIHAVEGKVVKSGDRLMECTPKLRQAK
jgi:hypothetical protein